MQLKTDMLQSQLTTTATVLLIGKLNGKPTDPGGLDIAVPQLKTRVTPTVDSALQLLTHDAFDVILFDLSAERGNERVGLVDLRKCAPNIPILLLTDVEDEYLAMQMVRPGNQEYLPKSAISPKMLAHIVQHVIERSQEMHAIRTSENRVQQLFELFPDAVYSTDVDGAFEDVNRAALDMFGYSRAEMLGLNAEKLFASFDDYKALVSQLQTQGGVTEFEVRMRHQNGEELWCLLTAVPSYTQAKLLTGYLGVIRNVTHRKALEEKWRRFEFIVNTSKEFMTLVDRDYIYRAANESYCTAHGKKPEEIVGFSVPQVWGEGRYLAQIKENFDRCFAGDEIHFQGWLNFSALGRRFMDVTYYPYYNTAGIATHAVVVSRDITERTRAEAALQHAHAQQQQLLATIPSILISVSPKDDVTHWNSPAEATFGIPAESVIGKPFLECGVQWDWMEILKQVGECRKTVCAANMNDVKYTRPDEKEGFLNVTITPFADESEGQLGFLLIVQDVTERKILESQLGQSQKLEAIGQLAAGIAHEINTPTQYVGDNIRFMQESFTDMAELMGKYRRLLEKVKVDGTHATLVAELESLAEDADVEFVMEELPSAIEQSLEGVGRVSAIVRAMKEFSHPGVEEKSAVDINKAIESTATVARNEWKYVADLNTDFAPDLPPVPCFAGEFNQVILNIIVNAAHAIGDAVGDGSGGKGTITITTRRDNDWVEIRISDTGNGIPEAARPKIFDPFFTTKDVGRGTGQGLAISHSVIVEKHYGNITFETELGKGTTFIIRLPLDAVAARTIGGRE